MCDNAHTSIMKYRNKKSAEERETWTFQPDRDVSRLARKAFGEVVTRGVRTAIVNEALRKLPRSRWQAIVREFESSFNHPDHQLGGFLAAA